MEDSHSKLPLSNCRKRKSEISRNLFDTRKKLQNEKNLIRSKQILEWEKKIGIRLGKSELRSSCSCAQIGNNLLK